MASLVVLLAVFAGVLLFGNANGIGGRTAGPAYLWFRAPLQLFFIWWSWCFTRLPERRR